MKYQIIPLLICIFIVSCQPTETTLPDGKHQGYHHHFKLIEKENGKLQVYSPVSPYTLIQTIELHTGEIEKFKKIFSHQQTLQGETAEQIDNDIEDLLLLLEKRNTHPSDEIQFEINVAFAELLPHE